MNENIDSITFKDGFDGDRRYLKGFLEKMNLIFLLYPDRNATDESKVVYVISRLFGEAMNWAASLIDNGDPCLGNYDKFIDKLKIAYGNGNLDDPFVANQRLRTIQQRNIGGIQGYISEFNKYPDKSTWIEEAKMDAFITGLQEQLA